MVTALHASEGPITIPQIATIAGGLTGVGLMEGTQKLFYLPYPYSDFIYAVIGEEMGMIGALAVGKEERKLPWK